MSKMVNEETIVGRILGYEVGLFEDGSLIIGGDDGDILVRITNKKTAQKFANYINSAINKMT